MASPVWNTYAARPLGIGGAGQFCSWVVAGSSDPVDAILEVAALVAPSQLSWGDRSGVLVDFDGSANGLSFVAGLPEDAPQVVSFFARVASGWVAGPIVSGVSFAHSWTSDWYYPKQWAVDTLKSAEAEAQPLGPNARVEIRSSFPRDGIPMPCLSVQFEASPQAQKILGDLAQVLSNTVIEKRVPWNISLTVVCWCETPEDRDILGPWFGSAMQVLSELAPYTNLAEPVYQFQESEDFSLVLMEKPLFLLTGTITGTVWSKLTLPIRNWIGSFTFGEMVSSNPSVGRFSNGITLPSGNSTNIPGAYPNVGKTAPIKIIGNSPPPPPPLIPIPNGSFLIGGLSDFGFPSVMSNGSLVLYDPSGNALFNFLYTPDANTDGDIATVATIRGVVALFQASQYEIYFLDCTDDTGSTAIRKLTLNGVGTGTIETLAIAQPISGGPVQENSIVVVNGTVYTLDAHNHKIWQAPVAGGQRTAFASPETTALLGPKQLILAPITSPDTFDLAFIDADLFGNSHLFRVNQDGNITTVFAYLAENEWILQLCQHPMLYPIIGGSSQGNGSLIATVDLTGNLTTIVPSPSWSFTGPADINDIPARMAYNIASQQYYITNRGGADENGLFSPVVVRYDDAGISLSSITIIPPTPISYSDTDSLRYSPYAIVIF